jgi:hypothetical protein
MYDFRELLEWYVGYDRMRTCGAKLAEQVTISRQQDAVFNIGTRDDLVIAGIQRELECVGIDRPEPACKPAEHGVGEKARVLHAFRLRVL